MDEDQEFRDGVEPCQNGEFQSKTAEHWAAEAMAADMDRWIIYSQQYAEETGESLEDWLLKYRPSQVSRKDGIGWICIERPNVHQENSDHSDLQPDVVGLQQSWDKLKQSGRTVNLQTITQLAMMHHATAGKWLLHIDTGVKVDTIWEKIAQGVWQGILYANAKVSPFEYHEQRHVVCIYNKDFTNQEQVYGLNSAIRSLGIKAKMTYKPDVYTYLGVYRNNQWNLRPTIYESVFDLLKGRSVIKPLDASLQ